MNQLLKMLKYKRPAGSRTELEYIDRFIVPCGAKPDGFHNYILTIGDSPRTLFSSHTDTVHVSGGKQKLKYDKKKDVITSKGHDCLGADDTTGNWLMLAMIEAKVEGLYIFHREEECGGGGSTYIAMTTPEVLTNIDHAVAFDRMGTGDVVGDQMGVCCSDRFAKELGRRLGKKWRRARGTFTDTANYTHLISECTNLSVGYEHQHTAKESQRVDFVLELRDKLIALDWKTLPVQREPTVDIYPLDWYSGGIVSGGYHGHTRRSKRYSTHYQNSSAATQGRATEIQWPATDDDFMLDSDMASCMPVGSKWELLVEAIENNPPELIASILFDWGIDADFIEQYNGQ